MGSRSQKGPAGPGGWRSVAGSGIKVDNDHPPESYRLDDARHAIAHGNEVLASGYDAVPYDAVPLEFLSIPRLRALAALFGCGEGAGDVLDLGCGHGAQLSYCADDASGRLVGVDLSAAAIEGARRRLAPLGERAQVFRGDLLELSPERLGRFDVIFCLGVISFVPPPVRRRILELTAACLNPGGVAVMSYYTGAPMLIRSSLGRILVAAGDASAPPAARVRQGRAALADIKAGLGATGPNNRLLVAAIHHAETRSDMMFFHELLNPESAALEASGLESVLGPLGVGFLGHHEPAPFMSRPTARERAIAADVAALVGGGYVYALFGKHEAALGAADPRSPRLVWSTDLRRRAADGVAYLSPADYEDPQRRLNASLKNPVTQALVDAIGAAPLSWRDAHAAALRRMLEVTGRPEIMSEAAIGQELIELWASAAAQVSLAPAAQSPAAPIPPPAGRGPAPRR